MRIIGGKFKSRKFYPPADKWPTRPTTDYAKEGLFNILYNNFDFEDLKVLDLFCGTGSHGYEFVSRGCLDVTSVDKFYPCVKFVNETIKKLEIEEYMRVHKSDVFKYIKSCGIQYDYIFAGPPYPLPTLNTIPDEIIKHGLLKPEAWLVLEHNPNHNFELHPHFYDIRKYGKTFFSIFKPEAKTSSK